MKPRHPAGPREDPLARMVSDSRLLDADLKRYWLGVLPHLTPESRARLEAILAGKPDAPEPFVGPEMARRRDRAARE